MKKLIILIAILIPSFVSAQKYMTRGGHAIIFSNTVAENITANNYKVSSTLDTQNGEMAFSIPVQAFEFEKALMQKHFNQENFMHSSKYPKITFKGKIQNLSDVKWDTDGTYEVAVSGDLTIRDVTKNISEQGTIEVKDNKITASSVFTVKQIGQYNVGKPQSKKKENNVADDIEVTFKGIYTIK
jgi:polyisoprenoid-binding protein YceI